MSVKAVERILAEKIIVVMRGVPDEQLIPCAEAMLEGGIRIMEVAFSASGKTEDVQTARAIFSLREHFGDKICVGAGTVLNPDQVRLTREAGGQFVISPDSDPGIISLTKQAGLTSVPGALTPTEIMSAHRHGADFVKLFPASALGIPYIKAVLTPLDHIRLLAVGGIKPENIDDYISCGVKGFGISSGILDPEDVKSRNYGKITENARKYTSVAKEYNN
ncbi:MAG: bifunctional 4-hydroxy-2-oxoglutarate aldolase/2-dehydro-3-deoxy-phosphogluconate aldolase [Clostridia bacterium]|nr:bifunctional 4-hydroxy-2-oxoglutarate aldolase/2-dehydro-3-deoxy-phosphogluconate aldolase [Clostridia bacterium]